MTVRNADGSLACICHEHKPVCDCTAPLNNSQRNFIALHVQHLVERWQWAFSDGMLRAFAPHTKRSTRTASVSRSELDDLVTRGLVERSYGNAIRVTDAGKAVL